MEENKTLIGNIEEKDQIAEKKTLIENIKDCFDLTNGKDKLA